MNADAIAAAQQIAAKLKAQGVGSAAAPSPPDVPGEKRKRSGWDDDGRSGRPAFPSIPGLSNALQRPSEKRTSKIYLPVAKYPEINFVTLLIGPQGSTLKKFEAETGAKLYIRGKGSKLPGKDPGPDDDDELHVFISADSAEALDRAQITIEAVVFNDAARDRLKQEQLNQIAASRFSTSSASSTSSALALVGGGDLVFKEVMNMQGYLTVMTNVPQSVVGNIIGRGGENIKAMQDQTGAHVQVTPESQLGAGASERPVTISGTEAQVRLCETALRTLVSEALARSRPFTGSLSSSFVSAGSGHGGSDSMRASDRNEKTIRVPVPNTCVGLVIGKGGETIRDLQSRSGAHIQVARDTESDPDSKERMVTVSGHPEAVADAEKLIQEIITQHQQRRMGGGGGGGGSHYGPPPGMGQVVHMKVPSDRVGVVIGKGGATIRELQQMSNCRIQMSKEAEADPALRTVIIEGTPEAIAYAQELIKAKCERRAPGQPQSFGAAAAPGYGAPAAYNYGGYGYGYDPSAYYQQSYYQQSADGHQQQAAGAADGGSAGASAQASSTDTNAPATPADGGQADPAAYAAWYAQYQQWYASQYASGQAEQQQQQPQASSEQASSAQPGSATS